jgi:hypothetical protein
VRRCFFRAVVLIDVGVIGFARMVEVFGQRPVFRTLVARDTAIDVLSAE